MASVSKCGQHVIGRSGTRWLVRVGLEVHAQVASRTKLFSASPAGMGLSAPPNSAVSLFDAAHPGSLPQLNEGCVAQAIRAGIALRGTIPSYTAWQRKHYAYADLPHGFQITQLEHPIVRGGFLFFDVPVRDSSSGARLACATRPALCRLSRVQLETDSGKSNHTVLRDASVIDLNRAGAALLELVGCPDLRSPDEAGAYVRELVSLLRWCGVSSARMEEGGLRVDVNVSVKQAHGGEDEGEAGAHGMSRAALWQSFEGGYALVPDVTGVTQRQPAQQGDGQGQGHSAADVLRARLQRPVAGHAWMFADPAAAAAAFASLHTPFPTVHGGIEVPPGYGPRVEHKNLTGARAVQAAVAHEACRQVDLLEAGRAVEAETRTFDASSRTSARLRGKEQALDYRFMPEADVTPLLLPAAYLHALAATVPQQREDIRAELCGVYGLSEGDAGVLVGAASEDAHREAWDTTAARGTQGTRACSSSTTTTEGAGLGVQHGDAVQFFKASVSACASHLPAPASLPELGRAVCPWLVVELVGRLRAVREAGGGAGAGAGAGAGGQGREEDEPAAAAAGGGTVSIPSLLASSPVTPARLGALVSLVHASSISGKVGKRVLALMLGQEEKEGGPAAGGGVFTLVPPDSREPAAIVSALGLQQINDRGVIVGLAQGVVSHASMAASHAKWRAGSERVLGAFVAKVLEASAGRANPAFVAEVVRELLGPCGLAGREQAQGALGEGSGGQRPMGRKEKARIAAEQQQQKGVKGA